MDVLTLPQHNQFPHTRIPLPASKSESNRALIIQALAGPDCVLENLAEARDTQTMIRLLQTLPPSLDVLDAGTTMRFLTAFLARGQEKKLITGTARMCERPIGILVDALRELGAEIHYLGAEGFPPLAIHGMQEQRSARVSVRGDVSSQYVSALLLIAPTLPEGLQLHLEGKVGSKTYIDMTLALMRHFGAEAQWVENEIHVAPKPYQPNRFAVEADWSGASYWFSLVACAEAGSLFLEGLKPESLQGDAAIVAIMERLGVKSTFQEGGVLLEKQAVLGLEAWDFTHCPDLAQTVAVTCAILGQRAVFTGLESLRIKETDRIAALQQELGKWSATLTEDSPGAFTLTPSIEMPQEVLIHTYDDHRMAMAFMPLMTRTRVHIEDPEVVNKSYPSFWKHLARLHPTLQVPHHEHA
ncbi:MAG: 3-phosphoshikimate 1-carboxyvinyltransferase [Nitritalea sp.]